MAGNGTAQLADVLADYEIGELLGVGARSHIYAVRRRGDSAKLAVKFIQVNGTNDLRVIGHLENEFAVLQKLHSTSDQATTKIVRPVEFRKVRRFLRVKAAYLLMERAEGRSLDEHSDYDLGQVLRIFRQVCFALEHIHRCGYVHADLKPQNIMVDDDCGVKLIDFGFAAPIGLELTGNKGTFGYLAPEQAAGRLGERTDVFNLGAALYRVLTGVNVPSIMPGDHEVAGFVPANGVKLTPLFQINPDVPRELSDMVLRCCSSEGHKRPTATQLKQYLHGLQLRLEYGMVKQ